MRSGYMLRELGLRAALSGIATGLISLHPSPFGYLTSDVFADYHQPITFPHQRANAAALPLMVLVLLLIVAARVIVTTTRGAAFRPVDGGLRDRDDGAGVGSASTPKDEENPSSTSLGPPQLAGASPRHMGRRGRSKRTSRCSPRSAAKT